MTLSNLTEEEKAQRISVLLKTADRHVLSGEFDKAEEQVDRVFKLDPNNIYAKAYLKRIEVFREKHDVSEEQSEPEEQAEKTEPDDELKEPDDEVTETDDEVTEPDDEMTEPEEDKDQNDTMEQDESPPEIEHDHQPEQDTEIETPETSEPRSPAESDETTGSAEKPEYEYRSDAFDSSVDENVASNSTSVKRNTSGKKLSADEQRQIVEDIVSKEADLLDDPDRENLSQQRGARSHRRSPLNREANEEKYRETLEKFWKKGRLSDENRQKLKELRETFNISEEQHAEIEKSVKLAAYVKAVKEAWEEGLISPTSAATLDDLRERYDITVNEHLMIESRIMYELHGMRSKGVVMLIDDDVELVNIMKSILREEGYAPFSVHRPEEGLKILERTTPDLILLDVTFPKPSLSGFSTYEQIRKRSSLRFVPVVFLSGLDEEHIVEVGKKLGADDYITKPCSEQILVSTIEGKIKRYREMRKAIEE